MKKFKQKIKEILDMEIEDIDWKKIFRKKSKEEKHFFIDDNIVASDLKGKKNR